MRKLSVKDIPLEEFYQVIRGTKMISCKALKQPPLHRNFRQSAVGKAGSTATKSPLFKLFTWGGGGNYDDDDLILPITSVLPSVHVLRARPSGNMMSAKMSMAAAVLSAPTSYNRSYGLGFVHKEHACMVRDNIGSQSTVEIIDYMPNAFSIVSIEKKHELVEMPLFLHEMDIQLFLSLPFQQNVNIGFVHKVLEDNQREMILEVQTLEAIDISPDIYRKYVLRDPPAEAMLDVDWDVGLS